MISKQEARIDAELAELGVKAHITHIKHPENSLYRVVTVASRDVAPYEDLWKELSICFKNVYVKAFLKHKSDIGNRVILAFKEGGKGVALCHYRDNFNRAMGRIIAKGRLLKIIKEEQ